MYHNERTRGKKVTDRRLDPHRQYIIEGNLEALKRVKEETGLVGDVHIFRDAIISGNLEITKYLYESKCPRHLDDVCLETAIDYGSIEIIEYFYTNEFRWTRWFDKYACERGNVKLLRVMEKLGIEFTRNMRECIIATNDTECLKYLIEIGHIFNDYHFLVLCKTGNVEIFNLVVRLGVYRFDAMTNESPYDYADNLEIVKYLYEIMKIEIRNYTLDDYVSEGNLEVVKYLIEKGHKPDISSASSSLASDNVEMIKYLHQIGIPFNDNESNTYDGSKESKAVYKYYHDNFYNKKLCNRDCVFCQEMKEDILWDTWYLDSYDYNSYNQWLPREMMEDIMPFLVEIVCCNEEYCQYYDEEDNESLYPA